MENNSFDEILTQFANRNTAGYVVWGQKLRYAHNHECEMLNTEIDAMTKFNDELNKQLKVLAAENARLRAALKPVLEWSEDDPYSTIALEAVLESQRIYNERRRRDGMPSFGSAMQAEGLLSL